MRLNLLALVTPDLIVSQPEMGPGGHPPTQEGLMFKDIGSVVNQT